MKLDNFLCFIPSKNGVQTQVSSNYSPQFMCWSRRSNWGLTTYSIELRRLIPILHWLLVQEAAAANRWWSKALLWPILEQSSPSLSPCQPSSWCWLGHSIRWTEFLVSRLLTEKWQWKPTPSWKKTNVDKIELAVGSFQWWWRWWWLLDLRDNTSSNGRHRKYLTHAYCS